MGVRSIRDTDHKRWLSALAVGALLLTVMIVAGVVRLQQHRIESAETNRLVLRVTDLVDALDRSVGQVLEVAEAEESPVPEIMLRGAEERRLALQTALAELEAAGSGDPKLEGVVRRADAFADAVLVSLQELAEPGAHGDLQQVATANRLVLAPLHEALREDLLDEVAATSAAARAADRRAIWATSGAVGGLLATVIAVAWLGSRARARAVHRATALAARRFESLVTNLSDVITVLDADGRVTYQSPSLGVAVDDPLAELTGVLHPEDTGLLAAIVADPERSADRPLELRLRHADETYHWYETRSIDLLADPNVEGIVLTSRDVTERRALEGRLTEMAFRDSLTGLGNRLMLHRHLSELATRAASSSGQRFGVGMLFFVDLDDFKAINDTLGHGVGDRALQVVAERLRRGIRAQERVFRLGGDEFALVVGTDVSADAELLADRLLEALTRPIAVEGHELVLTASMGIAPLRLDEPVPDDATADCPLHAGDGDTGPPAWIEDLLRRADIALYAAKTAGKGRWEQFDPAMEELTRKRVEVRRALRHAVRAEQFVVHYQPVIDLATGRVCSMEALVRWNRDGTVVGPDQFIHIAEDSGLIVAIGRWVLHQACRDLRELQRRLPAFDGASVAVNVSGRQLAEPDLVDEVRIALHESCLRPEHLVVEITESLLTEHPRRARTMLDQLRAQGITVAVDDFGTGYSSLSRLVDLPVDIVKIDKSFVRRLDGSGNDENTAIVSAILALAQSLALQTVAEGVETPEQLALLRNRACSRVQGFLFAKPMPFDALTELLADDPCW